MNLGIIFHFYNQRKNKQVKIGENNFKGNIEFLDKNVPYNKATPNSPL